MKLILPSPPKLTLSENIWLVRIFSINFLTHRRVVRGNSGQRKNWDSMGQFRTLQISPQFWSKTFNEHFEHFIFWSCFLFHFFIHFNSYFPVNLSITFRQCLLHRPGFQHLIAAAPAAVVVFFCCSIYYLSCWHRCPNPNSNNKILEKKRTLKQNCSLALFSKRVSCGNRYPNPLHCSQAY